MDTLITRVLAARRERFLGAKPVFQRHQPAIDLTDVEAELGVMLPLALRAWLERAGYGDLDEVLSFRAEWFDRIEQGMLAGHVTFAQDDLGNLYSFAPSDGAIHFVCRSSPEYAFVASDFESFLGELVRRDFRLQDWMDGLTGQPYEWGS